MSSTRSRADLLSLVSGVGDRGRSDQSPRHRCRVRWRVRPCRYRDARLMPYVTSATKQSVECLRVDLHLIGVHRSANFSTRPVKAGGQGNEIGHAENTLGVQGQSISAKNRCQMWLSSRILNCPKKQRYGPSDWSDWLCPRFWPCLAHLVEGDFVFSGRGGNDDQRGFARDTTRIITADEVRQEHRRWLDAVAATTAISRAKEGQQANAGLALHEPDGVVP
jgi:hypothetical protein